MFRISHVLGSHREHDRRCIAEIQVLFEAAFPDLARDGDYVERKFLDQSSRGYPSILLAAHGAGDRVVGFALADYFETIGYAYLDYIVTQAEQRGRGLGGALYEALLEDLTARGARGLFLEVPTDDPAQVTDPAHLKANKVRLKFYERYGARPIVGTLYDQPIRRYRIGSTSPCRTRGPMPSSRVRSRRGVWSRVRSANVDGSSCLATAVFPTWQIASTPPRSNHSRTMLLATSGLFW